MQILRQGLSCATIGVLRHVKVSAFLSLVEILHHFAVCGCYTLLYVSIWISIFAFRWNECQADIRTHIHTQTYCDVHFGINRTTDASRTCGSRLSISISSQMAKKKKQKKMFWFFIYFCRRHSLCALSPFIFVLFFF